MDDKEQRRHGKKSKKILLSVVVTTFVVGSVLLFATAKIIRYELGLYFQSQMKQKVEILEHKFDVLENEITNAAKLAAKTFGGGDWDHYMEEVELMQVQVEDIVEIYENVDCIVVYDRYGKIEYARKDRINFAVTEIVIQSAQNANPKFNRFKRGPDTIQLCSYPIFDENNDFVGTCFVAGLLSKQSTVDDIASITQCHATIFDGYIRRTTTIPDATGTVIPDTTIIDRVLEGEGVVSEMTINGIPYYALYFPIVDNNGTPVTTAFLGLDASVRNNLVSVLLKIIIPSIVFDIFIALLFLLVFVFRLYNKNVQENA